MKEYIKMKKWFSELIKEFHIINKNLPKEKQKRFYGFDDLKKPFQINILCFKEPEFGYIIINYFKDIDCQINAYGPFESKDAKIYLEKFSLLPFWDRKRENPSINPKLKTYREALQAYLINFKPGHPNMNEIWNLSKPHLGAGGSLFSLEERGITYFGNLLSIPPKNFLNEYIFQFEQPKKEKKGKKEKKEKKKEVIKSFFTSFYPPIKIGSIKYSFSEKYDKDILLSRKKILSWKFNFFKWKIFFQQDGRIIVSGDNKWEIWKIFNKLMVAGILKGLHLFKVQFEEICEGDFVPSTGHFARASSTNISIRSFQSFPYSYPKWQHLITHIPTRIEKKDLDDLMNFFKKINKKYENLQQRLLEAHTHYWNEEYDSAFILAYIIIEFWLVNKWKKTVKSIKDKKRVEKLTNTKTGYWSDDKTIEILHLFKKLNNNMYSVLMELKAKRNSLVHEGKGILKNDAKMCIVLARKFLLETIGIKEPLQIKSKIIIE